VALADDGRLEATRTLTARDYEQLVRNGILRLRVRDPAALRAFAERDLHLRNDVAPAAGASPVGSAGDKVTKDLLDRCIAAGVTHIPVVGSGDVVGFNATVFMVILIFVGMTLTLTEIFWNPVTALLDTRRHEIAAGKRAAAENARQSERMEAERLEKRRRTRDAYQHQVSSAKSEALGEANRILRHSQVHLRRVREDAGTRLHLAVREARDALQAEVPGLAERLVEKIAGADGEPGAPGSGQDKRQ
jgi:F0F1-type ATP synthase membrane subunit b/b'